MSKWYFSNNWCYTLSVTFVISNCVYFTRLMQEGDKGVINNMINIDQTIAVLNLTEATYTTFLGEEFKFSYEIMEGK
jgi:hypothetical protein